MYLRPVLTVVGDATQVIAGAILYWDDSDLITLFPIPWEQGLDD